MRKQAFYFLLFIGTLLFGCKDEFAHNTKSPESNEVDFFEFKQEEWNFVYEGREYQYSENIRWYRTITKLGDTIFDVVSLRNSNMKWENARCKVVRLTGMDTVFQDGKMEINKSALRLYIYYDEVFKSIHLLHRNGVAYSNVPSCVYGLQLNDTVCEEARIVKQDKLWLNSKPHNRVMTSNGLDIVDGISILNFCPDPTSYLKLIPTGDFRCIKSTYKNEFMEYDFLNR